MSERVRSRAVTFDRYGEAAVLDIVDVELARPGPGQVRVRVRAAGVQPFDVKLRRGDTADWAPARFPQGGGSEFAGVVEELGDDVTEFAVGDEVIGWAVGAAHADHAVARVAALVRKPSAMSWEEAGALGASGQTAHTSLEALHVSAGETVLIHAAAGGVGTAAVQIARAWGASVIGTASPRNHGYLRELGAVPVEYGPGLVARVREAAPAGVDAALDAVGTEEAMRASADLVTDPGRAGTIAGQELAEQMEVRVLGTQRSAERLGKLVDLYEQGRLRVHIHAAFPLTDAVAAHREVERGHVRGKVVLTTH
ncbi:NADP-dependent oxidoreductase [Phytoactinopolyspora mesophila]|uniref:Zinc-binding dehydrogenase n=1 Tax=Phytoactinopolyspora mesophila TaxID=2650750 RepID=A0A7K3M8M0_9ACTN|nr:NADP-dependent oxidoreductase [Phytoactinopolyspora mesophila]NDL59623.1 zinc-binding dehydrogenase [Phytoactinopolyspora mesophila]